MSTAILRASIGWGLGLAAFATAALPAGASAAVISSISATFPTAEPKTIDVLGLPTAQQANRTVNNARVHRQSITITDDITVGSIVLSANTYGNSAFTLEFYPTTDVQTVATFDDGARIGNTITVPAFGSTGTGYRNLQIDLDSSEQITLPGIPTATAGNPQAGYVLLITTTEATAPFNWAHSNTGSDAYLGGRPVRDSISGEASLNKDFGFALVAASVPEPSVLALFSLGTTAMLRRRGGRQ